MGETTGIEWTDATWNPWRGCRKVSPGCANCYMFREQRRYGNDPGTVVRAADATFFAPLKWKKPRRIFTCSWSDFFIEQADTWRAEAWNVILASPQHTYQILTKRPERVIADLKTFAPKIVEPKMPANVWVGVSCESQKFADKRIPLLLAIPAAVRFVSLEPLLGPIDLSRFIKCNCPLRGDTFKAPEQHAPDCPERRRLDWVIVGGESGPRARPMHPDWARSLRDQCVAAGVPFFFKQWGEWAPGAANGFTQWPEIRQNRPCLMPAHPGRMGVDRHQVMIRIGKKAAGRLLDGKEWSQFPS